MIRLMRLMMLPKLIRSSEMGKKGRKRAMWVLMMIGRREGDDDDDLARVSMLITALTEVAKLERSLRESVENVVITSYTQIIHTVGRDDCRF